MTPAATAQTVGSTAPADVSGDAAAAARPDVTVTGGGSAAPADGGPPGSTGGVPGVIRRRLAPVENRIGPYSWLATAVVVAIAAVLRLIGLSRPKGVIFDETYYATDAWDMLKYGVEWDEKTNGPAYVVHPPLGKWLIALGEQAFGYNEFGWRISSAVAGILSVLILIRVAQRLFRSTVLGCAAGLLLALDGFHLVLSRAALLDIFLMLFVLASFGALVLDRDARRRRWLTALQDGLDPATADRLPFRFPASVPWWRLVAAVLLGCGFSVKWSALWFVPAFALLMLVWEIGARRSAGVRRPVRSGSVSTLGWLTICAALMVLTYLAAWSGWFAGDEGYFRHWLADQGKPEPAVLGALQNLVHYHQEALKFHNGLSAKHTYQSWPWQWLLLGRPVAFYWSSDANCGAPSCAAEILLLGTPLLWWSFLPALGAMTWYGIARRDWRALAIGLPVAAGLLPWLWPALNGRTMFSFYALPATPFLVLAVVYVLGAIMTPARADDPDAGDRRLVGALVAGAYVLLVAICFAYFWPVFVGESIPYEDWSMRMWLGSRWI